jgi:hypothetical protein
MAEMRGARVELKHGKRRSDFLSSSPLQSASPTEIPEV